MNKFLTDIATHQMTVIADDNGVNRHILFARKGSSTYHFTLTTWSGHLCISGDMGTYVFNRLPDMFQFFRTDNGEINASYWGEKCVAESTIRGGITRYSEDKFISAVKDLTEQLITEASMSKKEADKLSKEVKDEVLSKSSDGHHMAVSAAQDFMFRTYRPFSTIYEYDLEEFTPRFIWCCRAIAWGILQYDAAKVSKVVLTVNGGQYLCADRAEASKKYQWLRDLSMMGRKFPTGILSDGAAITLNGQIWQGDEMIMEATPTN